MIAIVKRQQHGASICQSVNNIRITRIDQKKFENCIVLKPYLHMARLQEYTVDSYIGLQLICCMKWTGAVQLGYDRKKYSFFIWQYRPIDRIFLQKVIEKNERELSNADIWELLQKHIAAIPFEYRQQTWERCSNILNSSGCMNAMDKRICKLLEARLKLPEAAGHARRVVA